ncbi:MAG: hypothetical protein ACT4RN_23480 [Pseudonocardia sp.]
MQQLTDGLHGAYRRIDVVAQLGAYGLRRALAEGRLRAAWRGVVVDRAGWGNVWARAAAAVLAYGPDAAVCGRTAAELWGCDAAAEPRTHLMLPHEVFVRCRGGLVVHRSAAFRRDITTVDGIAVLTLERVVTDLLCDRTVRPADALAVADQALGLVKDEQRQQLRTRLVLRIDDRADRRGTRRAAHLLDLATGRAESPPESRLLLLVVGFGLPHPEVNWPLMSPWGQEVCRLDLAWPEFRIALEYDGYAVHVDRQAQDDARADDLRRRGWIVLRVRAEDHRDPRQLEVRLREAFRRRGYTW